MSRMSTPWPVDRLIPDRTWQPPAGTVVISADDHLMEHDLWIDRLPAADRDRAPRVSRDDSGFHLTIAGESFDQPGFNSLIVEGRPGMSDIDARLADMDAEAVDASFLFASRAMGLFTQIEDKTLVVRCYDAYNEWLADLQAQAPNRIFGVAVLPTMYAPETTAAYCRKLADLGFVAMQLPSHPRDVRYNASAMEPLWDAVEESGIPVSFHIGASGHRARRWRPRYLGDGGAAAVPRAVVHARLLGHPRAPSGHEGRLHRGRHQLGAGRPVRRRQAVQGVRPPRCGRSSPSCPATTGSASATPRS